MQPVIHLVLILIAWCIAQALPRQHGVHVLTLFGALALGLFAPVALVFILLTSLEAVLMVWVFRAWPRDSSWRKYGPYLLLLNLLFVDFHFDILAMPIVTLAISFSTIRIFMTAKQLLNSRKKLPLSESYWIIPAAFFLPALVVGPVFSGTLLRDQARAGAKEPLILRDYRLVFQGVVLVILVSPFMGKIAEKAVDIAPVDYVIDWPFLFLQLFAAFWGQSLIAEHTSRFFGLRLPINFDHPWKARTIKEFWARWHRSMAQFVLQYIFLPLNLKGISPKLATVCAFVFMGVWHNLSLGYLVWGLVHGTLLAFDRDVPKNFYARQANTVLLWIIVISLSWFANYGPWS